MQPTHSLNCNYTKSSSIVTTYAWLIHSPVLWNPASNTGRSRQRRALCQTKRISLVPTAHKHDWRLCKPRSPLVCVPSFISCLHVCFLLLRKETHTSCHICISVRTDDRTEQKKESWINFEVARPQVQTRWLVCFALLSGTPCCSTSSAVTYFKSFYKVFNNVQLLKLGASLTLPIDF